MIKLNSIKSNPNNPRIIKDDKFKRLVKSIEEFPEMMEKRPMVCVTDVDDKIFPLGGNMRLRAIQELGMKEIPKSWVMLADDWTEEKRKEFVIKDNIGYGEWDWDELANEWDVEELQEWGLDVWIPEDIDLDEFFEEADADNDNNEQKNKIVLEYTQEDYEKVCDAFDELEGSREQIVWNLLKL